VALEDTIKGFSEILEGKHDDLPEGAFYMVGTIEEAVERGKEMGGEDKAEAKEEPEAEEAEAEKAGEPSEEREAEPSPA